MTGWIWRSATGESCLIRSSLGKLRIPELPRTLSNPIRLGFAEQRTAHPAPGLGQHSEQILREVGLEAREIAALKSIGAVK